MIMILGKESTRFFVSLESLDRFEPVVKDPTTSLGARPQVVLTQIVSH